MACLLPVGHAVDAHGLMGGGHTGVARGVATNAVDDMGWQHQHAAHVRTLAENGFTQSMSRKGDCLDSGATEQIFGHMRDEFFRGHDAQVIRDVPQG